MSHTVHRFLLVEPADMDRFEGWLEDMARRGLHYRHRGVFFVHFRRGARLRPLPAGAHGQPLEPESQDYCRALGWDGWLGRAGLRALPQPRPRRAGAAHRPGGAGLRSGVCV